MMFAVAPDTFLGASEQTARLIVERGLIGDVVQIISNRPRGYHLIKTTEDDNYRKFSVMHEGGGIPYDMGGYDLHTLFNIFGPIEASAVLRKRETQTDRILIRATKSLTKTFS
ncbi:MAG: hypothetical protein L6V93_04160 [Clostridiales bacterium]|nr:MAG: hypothetical protein L6V93_04160 [Clostridiales bacterium]